jgi:Erythronolide synthase docking domain
MRLARVAHGQAHPPAGNVRALDVPRPGRPDLPAPLNLLPCNVLAALPASLRREHDEPQAALARVTAELEQARGRIAELEARLARNTHVSESKAAAAWQVQSFASRATGVQSVAFKATRMALAAGGPCRSAMVVPTPNSSTFPARRTLSSRCQLAVASQIR